MIKLIPYLALIWAVFWWVVSTRKPKSDSANDAVAFLLSMLGFAVLIGWAMYAIWFIPVETSLTAAIAQQATGDKTSPTEEQP